MVTYQPNVPLPEDARNKSQGDFLGNYRYLAASIGNDHNFSLENPNTLGPEGINDDGFHNIVHWMNQGTALQSGTPTPIEGAGQLYTKTVSGTGFETSEQLCYQIGTNAQANDEICLTVMPIRAAGSVAGFSGTTPNIVSLYNIATVTLAAGSLYTITFLKPIISTAYLVVTGSTGGNVAVQNKQLGFFNITTTNFSGQAISLGFDFIVLGG